MKRLIYISLILISIYSCKTKSTPTPKENTVPSITLTDRGVLCSEATSDLQWYLDQSEAPILEGLDVLEYPITTSSPEAQQYFNQGLVLAYGFNHAEAARSFHQATRLDPDCAMCYWGFAYVLGPNYNAGMEPDNYERAYTAIQKALTLSDNSTSKEKALIQAMATRYAPEAPEDRGPLDEAYADALRQVTEDYPEDPEIACLYAESIMNLHPWDLYTHAGDIKSWTPAILQSLDRVLDINPDHPGANHLYIHAVEASKTPQKGYASAAKFDNGLVPGSGHLIHMPSHIYIRTGDYAKGLDVNIKAVSVDSAYITQCHAQGAYPIAYYPHNIHFIAALGVLAGNQYWAVKGANDLSRHTHRALMKEPGWGTLHHYYAFPYYIAVKFARWEDILAMNNFDPTMKYPEAIRHFARGMAFLGKKETDKAKEELHSLKLYAADESLKDVTIWDINNAHMLIQIADRVLAAEILAREENFEKSIALLQEAIVLEDALQYQEPTDWLLSVRHHLGAIYLSSGKAKEAIEMYKSDLLKLPHNGWALKGLQKAYTALELTEFAAKTEAEFLSAWSRADIEIDNSRIW